MLIEAQSCTCQRWTSNSVSEAIEDISFFSMIAYVFLHCAFVKLQESASPGLHNKYEPSVVRRYHTRLLSLFLICLHCIYIVYICV